MIFGTFLCVTCGGPFLGHLLYTVPASRVRECSTYFAHGPRARIELESGFVADMGMSDLAYPERCVPSGALLEKRRFELVYRIDGVTQAVGTPDVLVKVIGGALGLVLIVVGVSIGIVGRHRRATSGEPEHSDTPG